MKTAMQDIQNMLEILWANTDVVTIESLLDYIRDKGIPSEKEQIMKAYEDGADHGMDVIEDGLDYIHSTEYYNKTYNQNK